MIGRLLCRLGRHRLLHMTSSRLDGDTLTVSSVIACVRACGKFEPAALNIYGSAQRELTAGEVRESELDRLRFGGELVGRISREVWASLPEHLQWALLAIDDCEAGRFDVEGLKRRLTMISHESPGDAEELRRAASQSLRETIEEEG